MRCVIGKVEWVEVVKLWISFTINLSERALSRDAGFCSAYGMSSNNDNAIFEQVETDNFKRACTYVHSSTPNNTFSLQSLLFFPLPLSYPLSNYTGHIVLAILRLFNSEYRDYKLV